MHPCLTHSLINLVIVLYWSGIVPVRRFSLTILRTQNGDFNQIYYRLYPSRHCKWDQKDTIKPRRRGTHRRPSLVMVLYSGGRVPTRRLSNTCRLNIFVKRLQDFGSVPVKLLPCRYLQNGREQGPVRIDNPARYCSFHRDQSCHKGWSSIPWCITCALAF